MKKFLLIAASSVCLISLTACSDSKTNEEPSKQEEKTSVKATEKTSYAVKTVNNVEMKIKDIQTTENGKGDKNIVQMNLDFKNGNDTAYGIGGNDFILESGDKTYKAKSDANNIGTEITKGKTVSGSVSFEIPKDSKTAEFSYKPVVVGNGKSKVLATWKVTIPANK